MHSNHKGAIAEAKIRADLLSKGFKTATPDLPMSFDLIVYKDNKFYKVQIKYCSLKNGCLVVYLKSNHYNARKNVKVVYKSYIKKDVDVFAAYSPDIDECFYFSSNILDYNSAAINLRIEEPKHLNKNIRWAKDYREFPV